MSESTVAPIACRVGLTPAGVFIESPRTGKRLALDAQIKTVLPRVYGRIVQKASMGIHAVPFTLEELQAVKAFGDAQAEHEAAQLDDPPMHFGMQQNRISKYVYWLFENPGKRTGGYDLRADDTFVTDCHTTDWPPFGLGLWFRHPCGPAMVVAGPDKATLPAALVAKFDRGRTVTFTGAELNLLNAAHTAMHERFRPARRRYRRF
jgi:hypothetical protein